MKYFWILFSFFLITNCTVNNSKKNAIDYIPEGASTVIKINNLEALKSNISNNNFISLLDKSLFYASLENRLKTLKNINAKHPLFLSFISKTDSLDFVLSTKYNRDFFTTDSTLQIKTDTLTTNYGFAVKSTIDNHSFFSTLIDSVLIASNNKTTLDAIVTSKYKNEDLLKVLKTANPNVPVSVLMDTKTSDIKLFEGFEALNTSNFTNYTLTDITIDQNEIIANGITKAVDSTKSVLNIFEGVLPQKNELAKVTPNNADGFLSITYNDFEALNRNLQLYRENDSTEVTTELFDGLSEIGVITQADNKAIVLNALDLSTTENALLNDQDQIETYRQITIFNFSKPEVFAETFNPFITFKSADKYCVLDNFIVFSNTTETLQNIIANYQNKTTLAERDYYTSVEKSLSTDASLLLVKNNTALKKLVATNLNETIDNNFKNYNASALQFVYDTNFAHVNAVIKQNKSSAYSTGVSEVFNIKLDAPLLNTPQFVKNHRTKQKDIVVQDVNNTLYLISNQGQIHWKKKLNGAVLGKIEQIDMYKNGRLQLAFTTPHRLYVLDRNGRDVKPFPHKFKDKITQPLSVFDYDKRKNYRLLITQGKHVFMFDRKGKTVRGFNFKKASDNIISQPQHFRLNGKDYLTFKTKNKLHIVDRRGRNRVTPKSKVEYSNQPIVAYKNNFVTTSTDGMVVHIDRNGNISQDNYNLKNNHSIASTTQTLVTQSENNLNIKGNKLQLDFGNYSPAKLFLINDKIYVTVTDKLSQKVYLYDSLGKTISSFPVYGTSISDLANADKDRSLELVTKGADDEVVLYELN